MKALIYSAVNQGVSINDPFSCTVGELSSWYSEKVYFEMPKKPIEESLYLTWARNVVRTFESELMKADQLIFDARLINAEPSASILLGMSLGKFEYKGDILVVGSQELQDHILNIQERVKKVEEPTTHIRLYVTEHPEQYTTDSEYLYATIEDSMIALLTEKFCSVVIDPDIDPTNKKLLELLGLLFWIDLPITYDIESTDPFINVINIK